MSFNALTSITPFVSRMDDALRTLGFDLKSWISTLDIATVGIVMLVAALGFLLFDLLGYKFAGKGADYQPYGRSLLTGAAEAWQNRDDLGLNPYFSGVRGRSLDMNNFSNVLDALSNAVLQWESPILSTADDTSRSLNTISHPKFIPTAAPATQGGPNEWGWN